MEADEGVWRVELVGWINQPVYACGGEDLWQVEGMPDSPMPMRGSLVEECVKVMCLRMSAGEWQDFLPGERRLAEILHVGRDTIRLALVRMERAGWVAPVGVGARRRILQGGKQVTPRDEGRALKIATLVHCRIELLPQPILLELDHLRQALAATGGSLEVVSPAWYEQRNPEKRLEALVREQPADAWLLFRSSAAVQGWFMKRRLPALIRGYPHPGIEMPYLDVDWMATARHAAAQLWRLGHRRVVVLAPVEVLMGVAAAVRGVLEFNEPGFKAVALTEDGSAVGVARVLARVLAMPEPPTALIVTRSRQAATALTWLASQGVKVPEHLSLITLGWEPFLDHLVPEISGYRIHPEPVAKLVVRRMERLAVGGATPPGSTWITPEVVKGKSMVAPIR